MNMIVIGMASEVFAFICYKKEERNKEKGTGQMFENISVKEAIRLAMAKKAWLLDIREQEDYEAGHLPTAVWAGEDFVREYLKIRPDVLKILYCDFGNQSMKLARELDEEGYQVASIVGGYRAYEGYIEKKKDEMWTMEWKNNGHF